MFKEDPTARLEDLHHSSYDSSTPAHVLPTDHPQQTWATVLGWYYMETVPREDSLER